MDNCMLPEEVVFNILLWLPVVSLLRFRSVCKTWRAVIDTPYFVNQHLLRPEDDNSDGTLFLSDRECIHWFLLSGQQFEERFNLDLTTHLPLHEYDLSSYNENTTWLPLTLVGSCNGIICLSCHRPIGRVRVALWNPATKTLACLPEPPNLHGKRVCIDVSFGYAVKSDDYKVVRIAAFLNRDISDLSAAYTRAQVYSLQTDSWRNVDIDLPPGARTISDKTTYWNGHYCCLLGLLEGYDPPVNYSILSFDFSNEVFEILQLPDVLSTKMFEPYLTLMRDDIACIDPMDPLDFHHGHFDIWVLTEYGIKESWTKLYMIRLIGTFSYLKPEGFSKNGKFLLLINRIESGHPHIQSRYELTLCDPKTQGIKNLHVEFSYVAIYKESLVSVKRKGLLTRINVDRIVQKLA